MKKHIWLFIALFVFIFPTSVSAATKYQVVFREQDGTVIQKKDAKRDSIIRIPSIPSKAGYANVGWSLKKGNTAISKRPGDSVRVKKNLTYYAVRAAKTYTVTYYSNDGKKKLQTVKVKGGKTKVPAQRNPVGYTFMGWDSSPNQANNPKYEPNEQIKVTRNMKLYQVLYSKKKEPDVALQTFYPNSKYNKVIFVGDSRTNLMSIVLHNNYSAGKLKNVEFIAQNGSGLAWFKNKALPRLLEAIPENSSKPTAIIFNHGINDVKRKDGIDLDWKKVANEYVAYFNSISKKLLKKNCDLYYMSLNPVNCKHSWRRRESEIRNFNQKLKTSLVGYRYIDCYSYLIKNGYTTDTRYNVGVDTGGDDGVHYTVKTYKRIYNYCIKAIL